LLLVESAGHYPHAEMPEKVMPVIVAFLAKVDALTAASE
jgi:hypothetical protein